MWDDHTKEDGWRILLVDARNAFNEVNRQAMLYKDLVFSKEGVTQGDQLAMILYALALLQVIAVLEMLLDGLTYAIKQLQKWFADDYALAGFFEATDK
eukprot:15074475-Ditylum_brightwellii.AAC.1